MFTVETSMQTDLQRELLDLETQFWTAMKAKDIDAALRLTDETCIVAGPTGVSQIDKKTFAKLMDTGKWSLHEFEFRDVKVQSVSKDVAIIGYKVREKLTVDGQSITLEAADASTWVRKDGHWVCAMHAESLSGDPYGRDRKSATH
jgi:ketosteroid isomerase-like protein